MFQIIESEFKKIKDIISVVQKFLSASKANVVYIFEPVAFAFPIPV